MNRSLKHSLVILTASAALGVAAGLLIAPRRARASQQSRKGLEPLYRRASQEQPAEAIAEPAPASVQTPGGELALSPQLEPGPAKPRPLLVPATQPAPPQWGPVHFGRRRFRISSRMG